MELFLRDDHCGGTLAVLTDEPPVLNVAFTAFYIEALFYGIIGKIPTSKETVHSLVGSLFFMSRSIPLLLFSYCKIRFSKRSR